MKKPLFWIVAGAFAILALLFVIGTIWPTNTDSLQSPKGIAAAEPLKAGIQQQDTPFIRLTCNESERILNADRTTPELKDWILLAPICNLAIDGKWDEAEKRLAAIK